MDYVKTFALMVAITLLLMLVGSAIDGQQGMLIALIIAAGLSFISYWFSDKIVFLIIIVARLTLISPNTVSNFLSR